MGTAQDDITELQNRLDNFEQNPVDLTDIENEIADIDKRTTQNENDISQNQSDIAQNQADIFTLNSNIYAVKNDIIGINNTLPLKEDKANKSNTIDSSTTRYPSNQAVYVAVQSLETNKANVNDVVRLTGAQTIGGPKTFTSLPVIPATPTANTHAASKGYVDTVIDEFTAIPSPSNQAQALISTGADAFE